MNIANQILFAVVITSVTGTAAYGLWRLLMNSRFCTKPQYVYLALFLVCLLYLIPLDYGWMQMTIHGYLQKEGIWQINFSLTGFLWILAFFAAVCWLALMAKGITEFAGSLRGMKRIQMRDIPEEEEAVREEFARVKKKLGIRSNIRLYRNDRITSPMLAGIFRCRVVLPDIAYDRKHLSVIFHHELMHYKSHDPFVRLCGMCVTAVHHINPLTGNLMVLLDEWSEIYCDARAIAAISDEMDAGCYFEMIIESVKHSPVTDENYIFLCFMRTREDWKGELSIWENIMESSIETGKYVFCGGVCADECDTGLRSGQWGCRRPRRHLPECGGCHGRWRRGDCTRGTADLRCDGPLLRYLGVCVSGA